MQGSIWDGVVSHRMDGDDWKGPSKPLAPWGELKILVEDPSRSQGVSKALVSAASIASIWS